MDKRPWFLSWLAPLSWLVVVVLLGAYVGTPARYLEAPTLAWVVTLAAIVVALTHPEAFRRGSPHGPPARHEPRAPWRPVTKGPVPTRGHPPRASTWYKGRSHSEARPRFD